MKYIIVKAEQDFDHIESIEYITSYNTESEAQSYIQDMSDKHTSSVLEKEKYTKEFMKRKNIKPYIAADNFQDYSPPLVTDSSYNLFVVPIPE